MSSRYSAPLSDIRFALFDVLKMDQQAQALGFEEANRDLMDAVLDEAARFSETVLAPLNAVGDREGCRFDPATGAVTTPPGFREAYAQYVENGWSSLTAPASTLAFVPASARRKSSTLAGLVRCRSNAAASAGACAATPAWRP